MKDIGFNIDIMEINVVDGDFGVTDNPSTQNGGLILYTKNIVLRRPLLGVGIINSMQGNQQDVIRELNRWKAQAMQDGAKTANYTKTDPIAVNCAYQ
jgi:hypothetical protein